MVFLKILHSFSTAFPFIAIDTEANSEKQSAWVLNQLVAVSVKLLSKASDSSHDSNSYKQLGNSLAHRTASSEVAYNFGLLCLDAPKCAQDLRFLLSDIHVSVSP